MPDRGDESVFEKELGNVIYCAGMTADYAKNFTATGRAHFCHFLEILEKSKFDSLVYLSSTRVYDGLLGLVDEHTNLSLNSQNPRHLYDLTKVAAESLCFYDNRCKVARLGVVYDKDFNADIYPAQVLRMLRQSESVLLDSAPDLSRDYILLDDVLELLVHIVSSGKSKIYNVASGSNIYNREWVDVIAKKTGRKVSFAKNEICNKSPIIDISLIKKEFEFEPKKFLDILEAAC